MTKTLTAIAAALMATTAAAADYPFEVHSFLCDDHTLTFVKDTDGNLSLPNPWSTRVTVTQIDDGFLIQSPFMYDGDLEMVAQTFIREDRDGQWTFLSVAGPEVTEGKCSDISAFTDDLLPILEKQLAGGADTQSDIIAKLADKIAKLENTNEALRDEREELFQQMEEMKVMHESRLRKLEIEMEAQRKAHALKLSIALRKLEIEMEAKRKDQTLKLSNALREKEAACSAIRQHPQIIDTMPGVVAKRELTRKACGVN